MSGRGGFAHVDLSEALNIFMRDFGGLGGFDSLFGGGRSHAEARRGQDVRVTVRLSLGDVATGAKRTIKVKTQVPCSQCGGTGGARGGPPAPLTRRGGSRHGAPGGRRRFQPLISV